MMLLLALSVIALTGYALIEVAQASEMYVRRLPKDAWALTVLALPVAGPLLWLGLGRPRPVLLRPAVGRSVAPDDCPWFIESLRVRVEQQQRLVAQVEQEIEALEGHEPEQYA